MREHDVVFQALMERQERMKPPFAVASAPAFGCNGNTIRTRSGGWFDYANPQQDQFTLEDIAGGLSKVCRYGGQCSSFYSVAEHSFHCACAAEDLKLCASAQLAVLMHDAAEAFIGDMPKPLKIMLPDFSALEEKIEGIIAGKFGIDFDGNYRVIRQIDREMLICEKKQLFTNDTPWRGEAGTRELKIMVECWTPAKAEVFFMRRANRLMTITQRKP